jgi:hypothetical protein
LPRSREAVASITKKGLRRALIEERDARPWLDIVKAIEAAADPKDMPEDLARIARFVRFLTAKNFDDAVALYDGRPLDAEVENILNLLPYQVLARLGARQRWTIMAPGLERPSHSYTAAGVRRRGLPVRLTGSIPSTSVPRHRCLRAVDHGKLRTMERADRGSMPTASSPSRGPVPAPDP